MTGDETGGQERGLKPEAGIRFLRGKNSRKERKGGDRQVDLCG